MRLGAPGQVLERKPKLLERVSNGLKLNRHQCADTDQAQTEDGLEELFHDDAPLSGEFPRHYSRASTGRDNSTWLRG